MLMGTGVNQEQWKTASANLARSTYYLILQNTSDINPLGRVNLSTNQRAILRFVGATLHGASSSRIREWTGQPRAKAFYL